MRGKRESLDLSVNWMTCSCIDLKKETKYTEESGRHNKVSFPMCILRLCPERPFRSPPLSPRWQTEGDGSCSWT